MFLASSTTGAERLLGLEVEHQDDLRDVDLAGALAGGGSAVRAGRGSRPRRLHARQARPLLRAGTAARCTTRSARPPPPGEVWQSTHVGGDRFAGNVVALPHGTYHGRVAPGDVPGLLAALAAGRVDLDRYRGRSAYSFAVQAAERALRETRGPPRPRRPRRSLGVRAPRRRRLARPLPHARRRDPSPRRRRRARRAGAPHLRGRRAPPPAPLPRDAHHARRRARHAALTGRPLRRARPRGGSPRGRGGATRTRRPSASSSPGRSAARNGSSASKHARSSGSACAGKPISLPSKTRVTAPSSSSRSAITVSRRSSTVSTPRRSSARSCERPSSRIGLRVSTNLRRRRRSTGSGSSCSASAAASPSPSPRATSRRKPGSSSQAASAARAASSQRVGRDPDRQVERVGLRRLRLVEPAAREVERVARAQDEVVGRRPVRRRASSSSAGA